MARKYMVIGVGPSKKDGVIESACAPIVELQDGRKFLGKERTWLTGSRPLGEIIEIEQTIVGQK